MSKGGKLREGCKIRKSFGQKATYSEENIVFSESLKKIH
jgi:hypothetical protein